MGACPCQSAVRRAGTAPPGSGRRLRQITMTEPPTTAGMAGAQPPPRRGRSRGVPLGAVGYSGCSVAPVGCVGHAQGYSRVLTGTQETPCLALWYYGCCLVPRLEALRTHTHASSSRRCVHTHIRRMHSRHARAAQRSRALRAGKYTWGAAGKNACPDGTARIVDLTACQAAATAAGKNGPSSSENSNLFPKGCYLSTSTVYFNAHAIGTFDRIGAGTLLLCAGTGVPASPAPPRRRHSRTCTLWMLSLHRAYSTVLTGTDPCAHHGVST